MTRCWNREVVLEPPEWLEDIEAQHMMADQAPNEIRQDEELPKMGEQPSPEEEDFSNFLSPLPPLFPGSEPVEDLFPGDDGRQDVYMLPIPEALRTPLNETTAPSAAEPSSSPVRSPSQMESDQGSRRASSVQRPYRERSSTSGPEPATRGSEDEGKEDEQDDDEQDDEDERPKKRARQMGPPMSFNGTRSRAMPRKVLDKEDETKEDVDEEDVDEEDVDKEDVDKEDVDKEDVDEEDDDEKRPKQRAKGSDSRTSSHQKRSHSMRRQKPDKEEDEKKEDEDDKDEEDARPKKRSRGPSVPLHMVLRSRVKGP